MLNRALRLVRVFHDLSQSELARGIGLSKSFISELESGGKSVSMETLDRYASYFGISKSSLMLFAERADSPDLPERTRHVVASKVLKMLEWIATISEDREDEDAEAASARSVAPLSGAFAAAPIGGARRTRKRDREASA